jgi:hypothetical protein
MRDTQSDFDRDRVLADTAAAAQRATKRTSELRLPAGLGAAAAASACAGAGSAEPKTIIGALRTLCTEEPYKKEVERWVKMEMRTTGVSRDAVQRMIALFCSLKR